MLVIIIISMLVGLSRGFMREFISLFSWLAAIVIAFLFVDIVAALLRPYINVPSVRTILAFGGLFAATLTIGSFINLILRWLTKHSIMGPVSRVFGLVLGFVRGSTIVTLLLLAVYLTPLPTTSEWQQSVLVPYFEPLVEELRQSLPDDSADEISTPLAVPEQQETTDNSENPPAAAVDDDDSAASPSVSDQQ
jgi:membrane protein required for colicin V production